MRVVSIGSRWSILPVIAATLVVQATEPGSLQARQDLLTRVAQKAEKLFGERPRYTSLAGPLHLNDGYEYWELVCTPEEPGEALVGERAIQLPATGRFVLVAAGEDEAAKDRISVAIYGGSSDGRPLADNSDPTWRGNGLEFTATGPRIRVKVTIDGGERPRRKVGLALIPFPG
jgi:hypothetical protein